MKTPKRKPVLARQIYARVTPQERENVTQHAEVCQVSVSDLVRFAMAEYLKPVKRGKR